VIQAIVGRIKGPSMHDILKTAALVRKSLVAGKAISAGDLFTEENLKAKRPGTGMSPYNYWSLLGTLAKNNYKIDELLDEE
jgi:N-acetylneuraminate synthase|tara:strand:- start:1674 stop:1916 length:243 start_codon:yes stop_codon:yes gene_type:complete